MAVIALTSATGSPGVSTTALGLVLSWPGSALLADFDHQLTFLAGYLQGELLTEKGMVRVLDAARQGRLGSDFIRDQAVGLPADDQPEGLRRLLLPGLPTPSSAAFLPTTMASILEACRGLGDAELDVVGDLGRMPREGWAGPVLSQVDRLLFMVVPTLRGLAAAGPYAERLVKVARGNATGARLGVVTVRRVRTLGLSPETVKVEQLVAETYRSDAEVADWLGIPVDGTVVHDARWASRLSDGGMRTAKWLQSGYAASLARLARAEHAHLHRNTVEGVA